MRPYPNDPKFGSSVKTDGTHMLREYGKVYSSHSEAFQEEQAEKCLERAGSRDWLRVYGG